MPEKIIKAVSVVTSRYLVAYTKTRPDIPHGAIEYHAGEFYEIDGELFPATHPHPETLKMIYYCQCCVYEKIGFTRARELAAKSIPIEVEVDARQFMELAGYSKNSLTQVKDAFWLFHNTVGGAKQFIVNKDKPHLPPWWYQIITSAEPITEYVYRITFNPLYFEHSPLLFISMPSSAFGINAVRYPSAFQMAIAICHHVCVNLGNPETFKIALNNLLRYTKIKYKHDAGKRRRQQIIEPFVTNLRATCEAILKAYAIGTKDGKNPIVAITATTTKEKADEQWKRLELMITKESDLDNLYLQFDPICTLVEYKGNK